MNNTLLFTIIIIFIFVIYAFYRFLLEVQKKLSQVTKIKNIFAIIIFVSYVFSVPLLAYDSLEKSGNLNSFLFQFSIISIAFILLCIIYAQSYLKISNFSKKKKIKYFRDLSKDISTGQVYYLLNEGKDGNIILTSTIVSLAIKKYVNIDTNNLYLSYNEESNNLTKDEKYVYDWLKKEDYSQFNINELIKMIELELIDKKYIVKDISYNAAYEVRIVIDFISKIITSLFVAMPLFFGLAILIGFIQNAININSAIVAVLISFGSLNIFIIMVLLFGYLFEKHIFPKTRSNHTVKGIVEMLKWITIRNFLRDFTNIENKPLNTHVILDEYLAYALALGINKNYTLNAINETNFY